MSMSEPAPWIAANSSVVTKPRPRPTSTWVISAPMNPPVSSGMCAFATLGAAASAAATPIFTRPGMPFVLNGGDANTHAVARTNPSTNAVTATGLIWNVMKRARSRLRVDELGDLVEEAVGEGDHLVQHPVPRDDEDDRNARELGHERQRDLLNLRRGLDQRDEQTESHGDEQDRRGELDADRDRFERD